MIESFNTGSSVSGQIKGMLRKHWTLKKRMNGQFLWELIMPAYMGGILYLFSTLWKKGDSTNAIMIPFFMVFYTPYITML